MMSQMRVSKDVWQLGEEIAEARGLGSPRVAIEAVVRLYARHYLAGAQPTDSPAAPPAQPAPASAQDALSSILSNL